ncbi:MAG: AtpZ/AtpI family protein [Clostridia bacterium]|nr:AtpZ/AtpI family protein [Clostridia bacterium]
MSKKDRHREYKNAMLVLQMGGSVAGPLILSIIGALLLEGYAGSPRWLTVLLILTGLFTGLYSMLRVILRLTAPKEKNEREDRTDE